MKIIKIENRRNVLSIVNSVDKIQKSKRKRLLNEEDIKNLLLIQDITSKLDIDSIIIIGGYLSEKQEQDRKFYQSNYDRTEIRIYPKNNMAGAYRTTCTPIIFDNVKNPYIYIKIKKVDYIILEEVIHTIRQLEHLHCEYITCNEHIHLNEHYIFIHKQERKKIIMKD